MKTLIFFTHKRAEITNKPNSEPPGFGANFESEGKALIDKPIGDFRILYCHVNEGTQGGNIEIEISNAISSSTIDTLYFVHTHYYLDDYKKIIRNKYPKAQIYSFSYGEETPLRNNITKIKEYYFNKNDAEVLSIINKIWEEHDIKNKIIKSHQLRHKILLPFTILHLLSMGPNDISIDWNELNNEFKSYEIDINFESLVELLSNLADEKGKNKLKNKFNNLRETVKGEGDKILLEKPKALADFAQTLDRMITRLEDSI